MAGGGGLCNTSSYFRDRKLISPYSDYLLNKAHQNGTKGAWVYLHIFPSC